MTGEQDGQRRQQREAERAERDRNRRTRHAALRLFAAAVEADETISGATLFMPDGSRQFLDASVLRTGGRA